MSPMSSPPPPPGSPRAMPAIPPAFFSLALPCVAAVDVAEEAGWMSQGETGGPWAMSSLPVTCTGSLVAA